MCLVVPIFENKYFDLPLKSAKKKINFRTFYIYICDISLTSQREAVMYMYILCYTYSSCAKKIKLFLQYCPYSSSNKSLTLI